MSQTATKTIKILCLAAAGEKLVHELLAAGLPPASVVLAHSNSDTLDSSRAAEKIRLEPNLVAEMNVLEEDRHANAAATEFSAKIKRLCSGCSAIFIVAGLGAGTGSRLAALAAVAARESGAQVLAFVTLPFECEGTVCTEAAKAGLQRLKQETNLIACFPNQNSLSLLNEATNLKDAFTAANRLLAGAVHAAWLAYRSEHLLGQRFSEVCSFLRQHSAECRFATAQAVGPNRADQVLDLLLGGARPSPGAASSEGLQMHESSLTSSLPKPAAPEEGRAALNGVHPSVKEPAPDNAPACLLGRVQAVAVLLLAGPDLALREVNRIIEPIKALCPRMPITVCAATSAELNDSLLAGLLVAWPDERQHSALPPPADSLATSPSDNGASDLREQLLEDDQRPRPRSRFVPPAPVLPEEKVQQLLERQTRRGSPNRKAAAKLRQTQLPLDIVSKGRFDKSEPTIHKGEDLDVPTYIRRGVALN